MASEAEIKAAYKRQALIFHPDKHSDSDEATRKTAEENFKMIGEALAILGDSMKRGLYDEGFDREAIEERVSRCAPCDKREVIHLDCTVPRDALIGVVSLCAAGAHPQLHCCFLLH